MPVKSHEYQLQDELNIILSHILKYAEIHPGRAIKNLLRIGWKKQDIAALFEMDRGQFTRKYGKFFNEAKKGEK